MAERKEQKLVSVPRSELIILPDQSDVRQLTTRMAPAGGGHRGVSESTRP